MGDCGRDCGGDFERACGGDCERESVGPFLLAGYWECPCVAAAESAVESAVESARCEMLSRKMLCDERRTHRDPERVVARADPPADAPAGSEPLAAVAAALAAPFAAALAAVDVSAVGAAVLTHVCVARLAVLRVDGALPLTAAAAAPAAPASALAAGAPLVSRRTFKESWRTKAGAVGGIAEDRRLHNLPTSRCAHAREPQQPRQQHEPAARASQRATVVKEGSLHGPLRRN